MLYITWSVHDMTGLWPINSIQFTVVATTQIGFQDLGLNIKSEK